MKATEIGHCDIVVSRVYSHDDIEKIVTLFHKIACEEGWQPDGQIEAHISRSSYFGLRTDAFFVGGLQIVHPQEETNSLPCHTVWPELCIEKTERVAHIAIMAVDKEWRGKNGGIFWELAIAMWRYCVENGITELFLEATPKTLRCYQRLGWPLTICGELRMHWGEPCYLTRLNVREVAGSLTERATRSDLYRQLLLQAIQQIN